MIRTAIAYGKTRTIPLAPTVATIPASNYFDPARFDLEVDRIFKRLPLMLAASAELPHPGDFKTLEAAGVPVLITRGQDGVARALINACTHRGANVATAETGNARRFVCPYHGWTFGQAGDLIGVASADEFGPVDKACYSMRSLPTVERAGLIWVSLDRNSSVDIDAFLAGYDDLLARFGFRDWHFLAKRVLKGPNWKVAYDGYLDFYHIPVLHRQTFGPDMLNQAIYSAWGPHQRVQFPLRDADALEATPEEQWPDMTLMDGVWTIFPHISIASFGGGGIGQGGRGVMISQLLPGDSVGESFTTQIYLMEKVPEGAELADSIEQFEFLKTVVQDEDYITGLGLQRALKAGAIETVTFGRNETGAQRFHGWVDRILATPDNELNALFAE
jgi:nitrite reductase/ring-hydroxylating ferredoxin subunit